MNDLFKTVNSPYLILCLVSFLLYFIFSHSSLLTPWERSFQDNIFQIRNSINSPAIPDNIVIVAIDENSMQEFNLTWPWPRDIHAELIDRLTQEKAAVIAFDVLFVESGENEDNKLLYDALKRAGNVILAEDEDFIELMQDGKQVFQTIPVKPLDIFLEVSESALIRAELDSDNFVRRVNLYRNGLSTFALNIAQSYQKKQLENNSSQQAMKSFSLPDNLSQPLIINYIGPSGSFKKISYSQVLDPESKLPKDFFKNKIVLIGLTLASTPDLYKRDLFAQPFLEQGGLMPGIEIHANIIDTLLRKRNISVLPSFYHSLIFAFFLCLAGILFIKSKQGHSIVIFVSMILSILIIQIVIFIYFNLVLPIIASFLSLLLFFSFALLYRYITVERKGRFIKKAFKHYVSPVVVDQLLENPEQLCLNGGYFESSVVFTDLVGFTSIAERMEPMQLRIFLTRYFSEMVDIFIANNGTLDKFIGDALMCFFGVPVKNEQHPYQAVLTAYQMQQRLISLNQQWQKQGLPPLAMRIGVNTGKVVAGNMGTETLFNYTIMGDCVNLGARLESINKFYGTSIIIGETTYKEVYKDFHTRKLDRICVKGKNQAIYIYELICPIGKLSQEKMYNVELYEKAFTAYQAQNFSDAIDILKQLIESGQGDTAIKQLKKRCSEYKNCSPGKDWDGSYTMQEK
jgi:adenylate cyclase